MQILYGILIITYQHILIGLFLSLGLQMWNGLFHHLDLVVPCMKQLFFFMQLILQYDLFVVLFDFICFYRIHHFSVVIEYIQTLNLVFEGGELFRVLSQNASKEC